MKVDISNILKVNGASLDVELEEVLEDFTALGDEFIFDSPVKFKCRFTNMGGIVKLEGHFTTGYVVKCSRCLNDVRSLVEADLKEEFAEEGQIKDDDSYEYTDKVIVLDKVLKDNIILNLPAKQICSEDCKGLCPECGTDLNNETCSCSKEELDPRMEALKDFFKN
ncbi:YceD family protein [Acetivibrio cellulolyticus]|uniref:YceD family protein n=1 Tax=Acetivibrio cellulolyticus TaxID=35830 RepID=UPI0001E2D464|nr:DUF177 domain-containing protein [Acetivibrio cellulolyticus]